MSDSSPYAAPSAHTVQQARNTRVAEGVVLGQTPIELPADVCVHCATTTGCHQVKQKLAYAPRWMSLALLFSCVVYVLFPIAFIVYFVIRKTLLLTYGMCRTCRRRRWMKVAAALAAGVLGLCGLWALDFNYLKSGVPTAVGVIMLVGGVHFAATWSTDPFRVARRGDEFELRRLRPAYLELIRGRFDEHDEMLSAVGQNME